MLENLTFLFMCAFFFFFIVGIVVCIDFCGYLLTGKSFMFWLEKILFEKFGR